MFTLVRIWQLRSAVVADRGRDKFGACRTTEDDDRRSRGHFEQRGQICGTIWGSHGEGACRGHMAEPRILRNVNAAQDQRMASPTGWAEKSQQED